MLSVVLITYNGEAFLKQCLDSIENQTLDKELYELVIVDDCSTDHTIEMLKEFESRFPDNVVLILNEKHSSETRRGQRNMGVQYSRGDYIMFLDQDDCYRYDAFERLFYLMEADPELDYIEYPFYRMDVKGEIHSIVNIYDNNGCIFKKYTIHDENERNEYARTYLIADQAAAWNKIFRKKFLLDNDIWHNDGEKKAGYGDNFFSALVVLYCRCFARYNEPFYFYRIHHGSVSHAGKNSKSVFGQMKTGLFIFNECEERGLLKKQREMVEYLFLESFLRQPFWRIVGSFDPLPYSVFSFMQEQVRTICPNYASNSIASALKSFELLFELLNYEWTPEFISGVVEKMKKDRTI